MKIKLTKKQEELIEKNGVFLEKTGITPAQARILSLLLISDKTELTFEEIFETLGISKSAASTAINSLINSNRITYCTKPGDRKRYFSTNIGAHEENFHKGMLKMLEVSKLLKEIHQNRTKKTKEFNQHIQRLIYFMEFLHVELPIVYEKWKKKNKQIQF